MIDALAPGIDLKPFFELMANERVLKVFHAARQDIEIVWHVAELIPHPIFDTQVAAMVLRLWQLDLLRPAGAAHHRRHPRQVAPLHRLVPPAADPGAARLRDLRRHASARRLSGAGADLGSRGRSDWIGEEMEILTSPDTYRAEPERAWQRLKTRVRKPKELAVLIEVAAWREREAQSRDVPRAACSRTSARRYRHAGADHAGAARAAALAAQGFRALEMGRGHHRRRAARARPGPEDSAADRAPKPAPMARPRSNCSRCCCA